MGAPLLVVLIMGVSGALFLNHYLKKFHQIADSFDLSTMGEMEAASQIYGREGDFMGKIFIENRIPIAFEAIPKKLVEAVVAEEDNRFYKHKGVDYFGIIRAAISNYRAGRITQGASTVTQQLARNSFNLKERSYERKIVEIFLAERIEKELSKDKIMELYLNRIYFGGGLYGAEAAALGYFGVPAKDMDAAQCALLAGLLKSPNGLSPWKNPEGAKNIRNYVLSRMREMGFLTRQEYEMASKAPVIVRKRANPVKQQSYVMDFIRQQAVKALGFERAMNGGYQIYTTIDRQMQRATEVALNRRLSEVEQIPNYRHQTYRDYATEFTKATAHLPIGASTQHLAPPKYLQGASISLENATGAILTLVGGRDFKHNEYNRATQSRRPVGTAFIPFVYAAAYVAGDYPGRIVQDAALDNRYVMVGGETGILGEWGVETTENVYEGNIPMREALAKGKNAATVRVGLQVGLDSVKQLATKAGIESPLRDYANAFLGSGECTLQEITLAYTIFPNGGWRAGQPYIIEEIKDRNGETIFKAHPERVDALPPSAAYQTHLSLIDTLRTGPSAIAYTQFGLGEFPSGGKSGTAYNFTDTYFFGYTSAVTTGVWVGFDKPTSIYYGAFGKDLALPAWVAAINASTANFPPQDIPRPPSLKEIRVSRQTGLLSDSPASKAMAKSMSIKEDPSQQYLTLATEQQIEDMENRALGRTTKSYEQEEWPRATAALDLSAITTIPIYSPTLIGFVDAYHSVRPVPTELHGEDVPIARAIPLEGENASEIPKAEAVPSDTQEVRRAEAVRPMDMTPPTEPIALEPPEPVKF